MKIDHTKQQLSRVSELEAQLKSLEAIGMSNSQQWWEIAERIDSIKYNL